VTKAAATDGAELGGGEAELFAPVIKNSAADGETYAGGENCRKTGPEEALRIGCDGREISMLVTHNRLVGLRGVDLTRTNKTMWHRILLGKALLFLAVKFY